MRKLKRKNQIRNKDRLRVQTENIYKLKAHEFNVDFVDVGSKLDYSKRAMEMLKELK